MQKLRHLYQKRQFLRRLFRLHFVLSVLFLSTYVAAALFDPGFFSYDLRQKFRALADETITITATVLGPPVQPVVTGVAVCNPSTGTLSIDLNWADDVNTETWDIDRDGLPLVSGLSASQYTDAVVSVGMTYSYEVTAHGPMGPGFSTSPPLSVTTPAQCVISLALPTVQIVSFDGRGIGQYDGTPSTSTRRPIFTGTTNIPNALIALSVGANPNFLAALTANSNGYWMWQPPTGFSTGNHLFTVTATDPSDVSRTISATLRFVIKQKKDTAGGGGGGTQMMPETPVSISQLPIDFSLQVTNADATTFQGGAVQFLVRIKDVAPTYRGNEERLQVALLEAGGKTVGSLLLPLTLVPDGEIAGSLDVPLYLVPGTYTLEGQILLGQTYVSRTADVTVREFPFLDLGAGVIVTYAEIMRFIGWISFFLLFFLLFWLFLYLREYWLYLQGDGTVDERDFKRFGYF